MPTQITLASLFASQKQSLETQLEGLSLPKDALKTQGIVSDYLNDLFNKEGEFRQNLTQSEDYILQAALSLLDAQKEIGNVFAQEASSKAKKILSVPSIGCGTAAIGGTETVIGGPVFEAIAGTDSKSKVDSTKALIGAGGGALVGNVALGGWGAVFGAIAGTAVAIYLSHKKNAGSHPHSKPRTILNEPKEVSTPINVESFVQIVAEICESVDNLIGTFRAQVNRVVQKYESQEKPTLDKEYRSLLESIQSLVGYERNHNQAEEKYVKKVCERIEDLSESLDNYDITLENYSEAKASWFDKVPSPNAIELKEVFPAVVKNGILIIPGKVFIPS